MTRLYQSVVQGAVFSRMWLRACLPAERPGTQLAKVAKESEFKSEDSGFELLAGKGWKSFVCHSESTLVQT